MTQNNLLSPTKGFNAEQMQRRVAMLEVFNIKATANAVEVADYLAVITRAVETANTKGKTLSKASLLKAIQVMSTMIEEVRASAELTSQCMNHALTIDLENESDEFFETMGINERLEFHH